MNMKTVMLSVLAILLLGGCAHYDPLVIESLYQKNRRATEITETVCEDFFTGALAFREGPENAYFWFGRAREIEGANVVMRKQGIVCYSAVARELSPEQEQRILDAFTKTWKKADEMVK
jgi:hypothetical protein